MDKSSNEFTCAAFHQDQVIEPPSGAKILAASPFCKYAALDYAQGPAISFQPHPEFSPGYAIDLLHARRNKIPDEPFERGLESLNGDSDRALIAKWIANFFLSYDKS